MSEAENLGRITVEQREHILLMGIDRARKRNGFTPEMLQELSEAYTRLDTDPDLWVGVLFGHGDHFTAGLDLPRFAEHMRKGREDGETSEGVDPTALRRRCRKPIVCAVQGITFTLGIELMLAADIAVAADDCRFSQLEPKRGIHATGGATLRFVERGGWGNAMYHLLTGDEFDATEARRIGLIQEIVPAGQQLPRALELAEQIARMAPLAVQATKASSQTYALRGEEAAIADFATTQARLAGSQDAKEGVASFVEKREPVFSGR